MLTVGPDSWRRRPDAEQPPGNDVPDATVCPSAERAAAENADTAIALHPVVSNIATFTVATVSQAYAGTVAVSAVATKIADYERRAANVGSAPGRAQIVQFGRLDRVT